MTETIRTADDFELRLHEWPARDPVTTVALCHGYGEHAGRYEHVATAFNRYGISVVAADLRGHGDSQGRRGYVERFSDYLLDLDAIVTAAQERTRGGFALLGHSMGGLISCDWLLSRGGAELDSVVLTSPFLGLPTGSQLLASLMSPVSGIASRFRVDAGFSGCDLTHDPEMVRAHDADPLINKKAELRTIFGALEAAERVHQGAGQLARPTLLLYAGDDRVVSAGSTDKFARNLRMKDRICERLPGLHHEILNEPEEVRGPLLERIRTWLLKHSKPINDLVIDRIGSPN